MLEVLDIYVKLAVDIQRGILAGGGFLHADCEAVLIEDGSQQSDIWGADWIPSTQQIRYEALTISGRLKITLRWGFLMLLFKNELPKLLKNSLKIHER